MSVTTLPAGSYFGASYERIETEAFDFQSLDAVVPDREVPRHTHDNPHFILVLSGIYTTEARNEPGPCPAGTLIYNPGGTTHRDRFLSSQGRFLTITPRPCVWQTLDRGAEPVPVIVSSPASRIVRHLALADELLKTASEGIGWELVGATKGTNVSRKPPAWLRRVLELLDSTAGEKPIMNRLAQIAGIHPVSLARAFRRHLGCSPGEYSRRRQLGAARHRLVHTDSPLAEIALDCGFADQSQMTRAFTSAFHIPPARFRRTVSNRQDSDGPSMAQ